MGTEKERGFLPEKTLMVRVAQKEEGMSGEISLSDDLLSAICLPDNVAKEGGEHLAIRCFEGIKAEPVMDLQSGHLVGYEYLSLLPSGVCAESFFRHQSATALTELFLLHLRLSQRQSRVGQAKFVRKIGTCMGGFSWDKKS